MQVHRLHIATQHPIAPPDTGARQTAAASTAVDRVFGHWVFMLRKRRAALGPARRRVIERAIALYDEETLLLAIDGCASSAWHAGENPHARAYDDIELILRDEAHIERFAADGEALRERAEREIERAAQAGRDAERVVEIDPAAGHAARERLQTVRFQLALKLRGKA